MRIALFTDTFLPKVDGIVTTVCQTVRELRKLGHQVLIIAPAGGPAEFEQCPVVGIPSHVFPFYPELHLAFPHASLRGVLAAFQPDLIHAVEPALLGLAALYYAGGQNGGAMRLPLVVSYHTDLPKYLGYYHLGFLEPSIWPLLRLRHNRATANLCPSQAMVDQLRQHAIPRVALWPGGVDAERFHPARRSSAVRARLTDGHPESPLLFYAGRLSAEKQIERLKPILEAFPQARLALAGDGPHRRELERHFAGLPVHFAGFLYGDDLAAAYASGDVFVMPSQTETLGLVVLEAMSSGLPVVAARAGGIPEMIEEGVSGFLFDQESQAIALLQDLLHCPEKRAEIGQAAREHASQLGWRAATLQLVEHYRTACDQQIIAPNPAPQPENPGVRFHVRRALGAATLFTIRKLLP